MVRAFLSMGWPAGVTADFTLRIAEPQIEIAPAATAYKETTGAAYFGVAPMFDRSAPTGARITFGMTWDGKLTVIAHDGTTTRQATTTAAVNDGQLKKVRADYTTDGRLSIRVGAREGGFATGTPLGSMNNANAVTTIGNSRTLDAAFPGSLTLWRAGATVPSADQAEYIERLERAMMQPGAKVTIDGTSSAILALAFDPDTELLHAKTSWGRSTFAGLMRVESSPTQVGTPASISASGGVILTGGTGVRIWQPALKLRDELRRRGQAARALGRDPVFLPFDATASQTDFVLPMGYTARAVYSDGLLRREGTTKDYTIVFDGFRETVRFAVGRTLNTPVSVMVLRSN